MTVRKVAGAPSVESGAVALSPTIRRRDKSRLGIWYRQQASAYALITPALIILGLFFLLPIIATLVLSFTDFSIVKPANWIGWANYQELLTSGLFWKSMRNTLYFTVGSVIPSIAIGLVAAVLANSDIRLRAVYRIALYLPVLTSLVAASMVWIYLYDPQMGLINVMLGKVGIDGPKWLADTSTAMPALIVMNIWRSFGYCMIVYLAGLQAIPRELEEAAAIDGAGMWKTFWHVTIPQLRPITLFLVVTSTVSSFQAFEAIFVMTKGGPDSSTTTVVHQVYSNAFDFSRMGYASAMAMVLFIILAALSAINALLFHRKDIS